MSAKMTNEEVIEMLGYIKQQYNILMGTDIYDEVIDTAIKLLKDNVRPQGEFVEKLYERIKESVCKRCPMNKNCVLCEISRVFQIIDLTNEEMKGGADNDSK